MDELLERELNKKYGGSFACIKHKKGKKDPVVLHVNAVTAGSILSSSSFPYPLTEWEFAPQPYSKVFNYNGCVYIYRHRPERQWHVGLNNGNAIVGDPLKAVLGYSSHHDVWGSLDAFEDLFKSKPAETVSKAVEILEKDKVATTIDDKFWLSCGKEKDQFLLWYFDFFIGNVDSTKKLITITNPLFIQEVNDVLNKSGDVYYAK